MQKHMRHEMDYLQFIRALKITLLIFVMTGLVFPALIWSLAQLFFPAQANGSLVRNKDGSMVGSLLIAQGFSGPKYFHPRPSAAGDGYDALASGGTNLGPTSKKLIEGVRGDESNPAGDQSFDGVRDLVASYRRENGISSEIPIPSDAVTRSGSGLDPDISLDNALLQAHRVAKARGIANQKVVDLLMRHKKPRFLGIFGEVRVNVLEINLSLDSEF